MAVGSRLESSLKFRGGRERENFRKGVFVLLHNDLELADRLSLLYG